MGPPSRPERAVVRSGVGEPALRSTTSMEGRLSLLVDLAALLGREVDFDAILRTACERVAEALSAERATVWLVDADGGELVGRVALSEDHALRLPRGRGIAGWVAAEGKTARVDDASLDPRFEPATDTKTGFVTRARTFTAA